MKNYYEELYQYMSNNPNLVGPLKKLEQIKNNPVEVIKMYNMYKNDVKNYLSLKNQQGKVGLREIKKFTIKSEDKAAFINRLEKLGIAIDSYDIKNNKLDNTFSIEFTNPQVIDMVNQVLKRSSKINQVKSSKNVYTDKKSSGSKNALDEVRPIDPNSPKLLFKNPKDVIKVDVPLFIRLLEYAREEAKTDMDLHDVSENIISLSSDGRVLSMADYNNIMAKKMQEQFNPNDYEWEEETDPKILKFSGKMDQNSYIDCDVLTINGEEKNLRFHIIPDSIEEGYAVCEAEDGDMIYTMGCNVSYWGMDGYRIYDIDEKSLEYYVAN
jgi:hypothetical protein